MFEDKEKNKKMIYGAYKKLKSYFYYDKTILYNKMYISVWESDQDEMKKRIDYLAEFLMNLSSNCDYQYINNYLLKIDLVPVPKAFEKETIEGNLLQNKTSENNKISKVNFFIKVPIEFMILDTMWTLMVGKIATDNKSISSKAYANRIKSQIFNSKTDLYSGIDYESNRFFIPYYKQYTSWRDGAFRKVRKHYNRKEDSIIISLDLKGYYYSVAFKFENLQKLLNDDKRLSEIKDLTKIIEMIYISYTSEVKKYRSEIKANPSENECIFPIGLMSSMLLANLYLKEFDDKIMKQVKPSYYGRYVDDVILVIKKPDDMEISIDIIVSEILEKNNVIEFIEEKEYQTVVPEGLVFQKDKMRCIYFDHTQSDAMIELLFKENNNSPSSIELMPDVDVSQNTFNESAYNIEQQGALKVRNFLFTANNYAASLFVNDLIKTSKNIDVKNPKYKKNLESQIKQIIKFYSGTQSIEYRSAWTNIFTLILINERYDLFVDFYLQVYYTIINIPRSSSIDLIKSKKEEEIYRKIIETLEEQLNISVSIAIAPMEIKRVEISILSEFGNKIDQEIIRNIIQNSYNIRQANMFNHHILSFPLINYIKNYTDENISLVNIEPKEIIKILQDTKDAQHLEHLDKRKLDLSPRFIHLDEICMLDFLLNFNLGGCPSAGYINKIILKFNEINKIYPAQTNLGDRLVIRENTDNDSHNALNLQKINAKTMNGNKFKYMRIAIASIPLDETKDIIPTLKNARHDLSLSKKLELYALLNEAVKNKVNMVVFPEFFLPIEWLEEVYLFARKNRIAIVSGLRYLVLDKRAYNYITVIQPAVSDSGYRYALPLFREKNHYAPAEFEILDDDDDDNNKLFCKDPDIPYTHLISWNNICYSDLMCYELTDIEYRSRLRSKIELLIVPELNRDTKYFSNIVESTSRDIHCFVAQVNSSKYGDSRITGPYNYLFKDIVKIKGGENNILLVGTINIKELLDSRKNKKNDNKKEKQKQKQKEKDIFNNRKMKRPSAGFISREEEF